MQELSIQSIQEVNGGSSYRYARAFGRIAGRNLARGILIGGHVGLVLGLGMIAYDLYHME
ncbi:hypothetical protein KIJ96_08985 [Pseudoalteromonas piscicida]|uniref:hypothetical protein n=1 Tax=Pseudoalteromonas TaxID=53246 RepID=UPI001D0A9AA4|nr:MULTISPECIES: hypothetical protein [Pseudoalteromonas]MCF7514547.1 hypothetical protein [Pseudoalteromonas sp. L7]MCF7526674.1 hypothetical protein [Pseudoalteromonas sp. L23]MCX2766384.1 hypothetical protein [Pseudoalteromonas sp. B530]UDM60002.1 hypothetical protein KIJ96_08985 [Pseudoalteromonas piscicida]